ncbi:MAG TPA: hypothetical protein VFW89_01885 [Gemmatimonadaceae bacterium]|nr:hypothetical protein [Gemmatimonadaceae bacterium]
MQFIFHTSSRAANWLRATALHGHAAAAVCGVVRSYGTRRAQHVCMDCRVEDDP